MSIYFNGLNISKNQIAYRQSKGNIERIYEGIYVDAHEKNKEALIRAHAPRIATFLMPDLALSHSSAYALGQVNGLIFGHYIGHARGTYRAIKHLQIVASPYPRDMSQLTHRKVTIQDSLGEFEIAIANDATLLIESFERVKVYPQKKLPAVHLGQVIERMVQDMGSEAAVLNALRRAAHYMGASRHEVQGAEAAVQEFMLAREMPQALPVMRYETKVFWYGRPVADLVHDGCVWRFNYKDGWALPLSFFESRFSDHLPPFLDSLMPERIFEADGSRTIEILDKNLKYLANIAINKDADAVARATQDVLQGRLDTHSPVGVFRGQLRTLPQMSPDFEKNVEALWKGDAVPQVSGLQMKVPMYLDSRGNLMPATTHAFTHLLKMTPSHPEWSAMATIEWFCLQVAKRSGLSVSKCALVQTERERPPSLVVERWDIRQSLEDRRMILAEDMCSVLGYRAREKTQGTVEDLGAKVLALSTSKQQDATDFVRQILTSWIFNNGDLHNKNMSILKVANATLTDWETVRLAPMYDVICTRFFPGHAHPRMCLPMGGKQMGFTMRDFLDLSARMGIPEDAAAAMLEKTARQLATQAVRLLKQLPELVQRDPQLVDVLTQVTFIAVTRAAEILAVDPNELIPEFAIAPVPGPAPAPETPAALYQPLSFPPLPPPPRDLPELKERPRILSRP